MAFNTVYYFLLWPIFCYGIVNRIDLEHALEWIWQRLKFACCNFLAYETHKNNRIKLKYAKSEIQTLRWLSGTYADSSGADLEKKLDGGEGGRS